MSETGIETRPVDPWAAASMLAAVLTLLALCGGIAPIPLTGFVCFPAAAFLGILAVVAGATGLRRTRASGQAGRTYALIGIGTGGLVLAATLCLLVLSIWLYPSLVDLIHRLKL